LAVESLPEDTELLVDVLPERMYVNLKCGTYTTMALSLVLESITVADNF